MKNCPVCHNEPATNHPIYGILPGVLCKSARDGNVLPAHPVEMAGDSIKSDRKTFAKSVVQPFSSDGTLSREYLEAHGTKGIKVTEKDVKNAKYIWDKSPNFDITKSK